MNADKLKELGDKAQALGRLKDQEGWHVLRDIVEREEKKYFDGQLKAMRAGKNIDLFEVRAHSIAFELVNYLLAHPDKAERTLQGALRKATAIDEVNAFE